MGSFDLYPGNGMFKSFTKTWHSKPYPSISPSRPELSAKGKTVFITGGGTGIGKATAIAYAQAGAKAIAIFGRRIEKLQSTAEEISKIGNTNVVYESVDLAKLTDVKKAFQNAASKIGGEVDVFISNAAILSTLGLFDGYSEGDLDEALRCNLVSAFNALQGVLPVLNKNATVLNITSGIGHIDVIPKMWSYAMTKAATIKMFDYLQVENPGLRVFNVHPGVVETQMSKKSDFAGQDEVELPARFHLWLASAEADFLKGKLVWVNWDVDELKSRSDEIQGSLLLRVLLHGVPL